MCATARVLANFNLRFFFVHFSALSLPLSFVLLFIAVPLSYCALFVASVRCTGDTGHTMMLCTTEQRHSFTFSVCSGPLGFSNYGSVPTERVISILLKIVSPPHCKMLAFLHVTPHLLMHLHMSVIVYIYESARAHTLGKCNRMHAISCGFR